jgi:tryptophanyl-tRNA synthetase
VAEVVIAALDPIRKKTEELMNDKAQLLQILKSGAEKADAVASKTLADTYAALGLISNG